MKKKLFLSIFFLSMLTLYFFSVSRDTKSGETISTQSLPGNQFIIGAMDNAYDLDYSNTQDLNLNLWHKYTGPHGGWLDKYGSLIPDDNINYPTPQAIGDRLSENESNGLYTLMDRPKFNFLAFGQRSDYQCEPITIGDDYWFHSYETHQTGTVVSDVDPVTSEEVTAIRCTPSQSTDGGQDWIVKDLRSNREQANYQWNYWNNDDYYEWFVMPKIRIDSTFAANPTNWNKKVCKIEIVNWYDSVVKSVDIHVTNFFPDSGSYNGKYLLEYFPKLNFPIDLEFGPGPILNPDTIFFAAWNVNCGIDYRVWYYDECEMWIDFVRLENLPARELFSGIRNPWIEEEVNMALNNGGESPFRFYIEEFEFNITPSLAYLNEMIQELSDDRFSLTFVLNYDLYRAHIPDVWGNQNGFSISEIKKYLVDGTGITDLFHSTYPLEGWQQGDGHPISYNPNTLPAYATYQGDYDKAFGMLTYKTTPTAYDDWLQDYFDEGFGGTKIISMYKFMDELNKTSGVSFINLLQGHLWWSEGHKLKEPTNQELDLMTNLGISYGARGNVFFYYGGHHSFDDPIQYGRGLSNPSGTSSGAKPPRYYADSTDTPDGFTLDPRVENVYGQEKWDFVSDLNERLHKWGPYVMSFDDINRQSAIYRDASERYDFLNNTFFSDVITYKPGSGTPSCIEDDPGETAPTGYIFECLDKRYLQTTVFKNDSANSHYFMIANRRCSPHINTSNDDKNGGRRLVKARFDNNSPAFANFNNWKIINLETETEVAVFDKSNSGLVTLGDFQPGEGKLFKIAPVMQEGGTLVTDEVVSAEQTFVCKAPVFNDGNDITIEYGVTVKFLQGSYIEMDGGSFYSGDLQSGTEVFLTAETGNTWNGLTLIDNPRVEILNTVFEHIGVDVPTYTAVNLSNPHVLKIIESQFVNTNSNNLSVAVDYNFTSQPREITAVINGNTFNTFGSTMVGIYCTGSSSVDLQIKWNDFTNPSSTNGINALELSGVSGGVVKNNSFTNFSTSVKTLNSSVDYFNNQITSSFNGYGLELTSTSNANMSGPSDLVFGGNNFFYNDHNEASNVKVENSTFEIAEGYNYFDISETAPISSYHLLGYFPSPGFGEPSPVEAMLNCFKFSGEPTEDPRANVTWGAFGGQIDFIFEDFDCSGAEEYSIGLIVDLGEGEYDTIYSKSGGSSGGQSGGMSTLTFSQLVNEMYLLTRKKEYEDLYEICEQLLQNYPDSSSTNDVLSKIYLAALKTDVEGNVIGNLKTLLEQLILNNGENSKIVEKSFYLIQKCKAALGDYSGAMTGFQQIMNNNPYSYEALLASWDYSAMSLHQGSGGSGGAKSGEKNVEGIEESAKSGTLLLLFDDRDDRYDRTTFTKEDRKVILENTKAVIEKNREKTIEKVIDLKQKSLDGDKRADKELKVMNALKESARIFKPKDNKEHFERIKQDVHKLAKLTTPESTMDLTPDNIIPSEYSLNQNYPNPFNPTTKISFDLPKDSRVTLKIFDITGREIVVLLNNEIRTTGRHIMDFNARGLASGVYFYRLEANDFVQTKRMVLLK